MDLLNLAITGAIISILSQLVKKYFATKWARMVLAVLMSLAIGLIAYYGKFLGSNVWNALLASYASANTWYLLIIKWLN